MLFCFRFQFSTRSRGILGNDTRALLINVRNSLKWKNSLHPTPSCSLVPPLKPLLKVSRRPAVVQKKKKKNIRMNKIGNVTFWKLDVGILFENISLLAAQDSVQILPVCSDVCRRAPSDCLFAAFLDKSRQTTIEMHCAKVTAFLATLTKNLKSALFLGVDQTGNGPKHPFLLFYSLKITVGATDKRKV